MPRLLHYASAPLGPIRSVAQASSDVGPFGKPRGLWVSAEGEHDWRWWCEAEGYGLNQLTHVHAIELAGGARILRLSGAVDLDRFTASYGVEIGFRYPRIAIQWPLVAAAWQGIIIAPYVWSRRMTEHTSWYYGWDCASGCIWDADAIASARLVEVHGMSAA